MKIAAACLQFEPHVGNLAHNRQRSIDLINTAADEGANLIVLPELCSSGYAFQSHNEAYELSKSIPDGTTCRAWLDAASRHDVHIVAGINERTNSGLFNSAVVLGPQGHLGTYRKVHLWNQEHRFFAPGNLGFPVFDTPFGRIGVLICYDGWFPESYRECALQNADVICVPTNWVPIPGQCNERDAMVTILTMAAAHSNRLMIACASRIGKERGQAFIGQCQIVTYSGWPIAGPASSDREEILYAEMDPHSPRRSTPWNEFNQDPLADRRPDSYSAWGNRSGVRRIDTLPTGDLHDRDLTTVGERRSRCYARGDG